jgi:AraC-like DNA-binding protein
MLLKTSKMQSETFLIRQHFQDVDDFTQTARGWNLNIRQLERGRFEGDLLQFGTANVIIAHAGFYPGTYQQGDPPKDLRTLGILADPSSHLTWRHKMIPANAVMVFPPGAELDAVSQGGRLAVFTFSFSNKLLADVSQSVGFLDLEKSLNGVHRDLKNADSAPTKITDVAIYWGFWHISQFAIDYQRFFGELPSQTMNRHK